MAVLVGILSDYPGPGNWRQGDIVDIYPDGTDLGRKVVGADGGGVGPFFIVYIPGATVAECDFLRQAPEETVGTDADGRPYSVALKNTRREQGIAWSLVPNNVKNTINRDRQVTTTLATIMTYLETRVP